MQETLALKGGPKAQRRYHEPEWWHHLPIIADRFPGVEDRERGGFQVPYFTKEMPEVTEQYITAFQKVWAHRKSLA